MVISGGGGGGAPHKLKGTRILRAVGQQSLMPHSQLMSKIQQYSTYRRQRKISRYLIIPVGAPTFIMLVFPTCSYVHVCMNSIEIIRLKGTQMVQIKITDSEKDFPAIAGNCAFVSFLFGRLCVGAALSEKCHNRALDSAQFYCHGNMTK
jgi:hypothetical protein